MSERSLTIWKLLITFAALSILAGGFSLYPKNKKYRKIVDKSVRTFGTDKEDDRSTDLNDAIAELTGMLNTLQDKVSSNDAAEEE